MIIASIEDLQRHLDAGMPTVSSISHRAFKLTGCGAHINVMDEQARWHLSGEDWTGHILSVIVGSICGQCDAEFRGDNLPTPFDSDILDRQLQGIDDQVETHWIEAGHYGSEAKS